MSQKKIASIVIATVLVLAIVIVGSQCFTVVKSGNTGVTVTLGAVADTTITEGLHVKVPFVQSVVQMNNRTQKVETSGSSSSKDLQIVTYVVVVNYHVENSQSAYLYKKVGTGYESIIITPAIQESFKAVTAQFTAEELITQRQSVSDKIKEALSEKISSYGITVEIFNIVNFEFSDEFNAAVEAKQTAQQNALKAEQDLARIEVEAKQKVTQAQAEADSINLIQSALSKSPDYVEYIKWNKWDGVLPGVMGTNDLMIDLGNVTDNKTKTT